MAEFKDIIEGAHKICESTLCGACKTLYPCIYKICNNELHFCNASKNFMGIEAEVLQFLENHPDPVYPTWLDWLRDNSSKPIPEEIAKKLGIEPIEPRG